MAGLLCYVLGWISGLAFILIEKESKLVRFHAMQSIIVFGVLTIAFLSLNYIGEIGLTIGIFLVVLAPILWIVLMVEAYQGTRYKLPWAGNLASKWAGQITYQ